jgi:hypothetical protein
VAESQQGSFPKPGPPRKRVCDLATELGVSLDKLTSFIFVETNTILEPTDLVAASVVMMARQHFPRLAQQRRPNPRSVNKPRGRRSDKHRLEKATRDLFGNPSQQVRPEVRTQGADFVQAARKMFPIQIASDEEARSVADHWAEKGFAPSEVLAWWNAGLELLDAGLAWRARNVDLKPSDLARILDGRPVLQRIRDGESLSRIRSQLYQGRTHHTW